jgi:uncharacterized LabA/DUF88 family protein
MNRVAVFVDAGYLFAQGSVSVTGSKQPRHSMVLDAQMVIAKLKALSDECSPGTTLLRIYWYDGMGSYGQPSADQVLLAESDDVKLRLGLINSHGQQKGVDSLIVTDIIELARQKSICDALLVSGDEDIRIGVQIAQSYGVRVHLLGLHPSRSSQSRTLMQESDTTHEWMPENISEFLTVKTKQTDPVVIDNKPGPTSANATPGFAKPASAKVRDEDEASALDAAASQAAQELSEPDLRSLKLYWQTDRGIPKDLDKRLLGAARDRLGRNLEPEELKKLRLSYRTAAKKRLATEVLDEMDQTK